MIDPDIKPIYTDEVLFGYATPFAAAYSVDVFFMFRTMKNFIEDVPSRLAGTAPNSGPFVAANLPCVRFAACRSADARRTYRAITADVRRRLLNGWMSDVSYTWSRFEGNFDLDYSLVSVFNTSSFIQDGPGTNVEDPNRFGPLLEDRPHVFKVFTSYAATSRVTASGYLRVQSGTPWTARGRDWAGAMMIYLEPAGSHRNPTWANLDVMGAYRVPLNERASVSFEARVLNVFNNQTRLSTDSLQYLDLRTVATAPYFAAYLQSNPFFSTGNGFAPPRRLHVAAVVSFYSAARLHARGASRDSRPSRAVDDFTPGGQTLVRNHRAADPTGVVLRLLPNHAHVERNGGARDADLECGLRRDAWRMVGRETHSSVAHVHDSHGGLVHLSWQLGGETFPLPSSGRVKGFECHCVGEDALNHGHQFSRGDRLEHEFSAKLLSFGFEDSIGKPGHHDGWNRVGIRGQQLEPVERAEPNVCDQQVGSFGH